MDYAVYPGPDYDEIEWAQIIEPWTTAMRNLTKAYDGMVKTLTSAFNDVSAASTEHVLVNYLSSATADAADMADNAGRPDIAKKIRREYGPQNVYPTSRQPWQDKRPRR